jgi:flagellar protein FlgJ
MSISGINSSAAFDTAALQLRAPKITSSVANTPENIEKSAKDFEAMFMSEMLGHMFNGMETDPTFGGGHGEDMFRSFMVQEYGKMMSHNGTGIGIAKQVKEALLKLQETK